MSTNYLRQPIVVPSITPTTADYNPLSNYFDYCNSELSVIGKGQNGSIGDSHCENYDDEDNEAAAAAAAASERTTRSAPPSPTPAQKKKQRPTANLALNKTW